MDKKYSGPKQKKDMGYWSMIKSLKLIITYPFTDLSKLISSLLLSYFIHKLYRPNSVCNAMAELSAGVTGPAYPFPCKILYCTDALFSHVAHFCYRSVDATWAQISGKPAKPGMQTW